MIDVQPRFLIAQFGDVNPDRRPNRTMPWAGSSPRVISAGDKVVLDQRVHAVHRTSGGCRPASASPGDRLADHAADPATSTRTMPRRATSWSSATTSRIGADGAVAGRPTFTTSR